MYGCNCVVGITLFLAAGSFSVTLSGTNTVVCALIYLFGVSVGGCRCGEDFEIITAGGSSATYATANRLSSCIARVEKLDNRMCSGCGGNFLISP